MDMLDPALPLEADMLDPALPLDADMLDPPIAMLLELELDELDELELELTS